MKVFRTIFIGVLIFCCLSSFAQTNRIKAGVSKNTILLGEPFELRVEIGYPVNSIHKSFRFDSIPHFEFVGNPVYDSTVSNGMVNIIASYQLTSFDSGHWTIPSIVLNNRLKSDTLPVDVVFSPFNPDMDYHDIKTIIEVPPAKKKQWWWWAAGGALLLAALIIYFIKRKKPEKKPLPVISVNAYDEAMKQLEKLKNTRTDPKTWHSALTDIFRQYVFRRKGIYSLQKTTDDLVIQLKQLNLSREALDNLAQSLRLSDFVKFAKYTPTEQDNILAFDAVRNSIQLIERSDNKAE